MALSSKIQNRVNPKAIVVDYKATKPRAGCPLDYSFNNLTSLHGLQKVAPKSGTPTENVQLESLGPQQQADPNATAPQHSVSKRSAATTYNATSIRLCNNMLSTLDGLEPALGAVLDDPAELEWLDLSYNQLRSIEEVVARYPKLQVLYLHSNNITKLSEVRRLASLPRLTKLTLHGNIIEELPNYRLYVAAVIPTLKTLDFVPITKVERDTVNTRFRKEEDFRRALRACSRQARRSSTGASVRAE